MKNAFMYRKIISIIEFRSLRFIPLIPAILLALAGCGLYGNVGGSDTNIAGALPELLHGKWAYIPSGSDVPSEIYFITGKDIQYGYGGGGSDTDYKGTIQFVSNYSSGSGLIIIEYTEKPGYPLYNGNLFSAIYYRNLKAGTVQLANVISPDKVSAADTATLEEAINKFTRTSMGMYVDWNGVQPQRRID